MCPTDFAEILYLPRLFWYISAKPYAQVAAMCRTQYAMYPRFVELILSALGKEGLLCAHVCRKPKLSVPSIEAPQRSYFVKIVYFVLSKAFVEWPECDAWHLYQVWILALFVCRVQNSAKPVLVVF